jgi:hypothetical protein
MRSLATHILAALAGIGLGIAVPSTRTIPPGPPPTPVRDRLPATELETRVSISPPAIDKQATPYRVIPIDVDGSANELAWCAALQAKIGGELERGVGKGPSYGRVDLLTDEFAVEVDWISNWQAGIGQALHYAHETGKAPVLAIALKEKRGVFRGDREECEYVAKICAEKDIVVWVLHVEP